MKWRNTWTALKKKNVADYSDKEVNKIIRIINNIIFCQRTSRHNSCLFYNIDNTLKLNLKALEMRRETKYKDEKYRTVFSNKIIQRNL